jgi:hypothetical protein
VIKAKLCVVLGILPLLLTACGDGSPSDSIVKQAIIQQDLRGKDNAKLDTYTINRQYTYGAGKNITYVYDYTAIFLPHEPNPLVGRIIPATFIGKVELQKQENGDWSIDGSISSCC